MFWYTSHQPPALSHPMWHRWSEVFDDGLPVLPESKPLRETRFQLAAGLVDGAAASWLWSVEYMTLYQYF